MYIIEVRKFHPEGNIYQNSYKVNLFLTGACLKSKLIKIS